MSTSPKRIWHDWTTEERELFSRLVREQWRDANPEFVSHLMGLKLAMFEKQLTFEEIAKANNILEAIKLGMERPNA